MDIPTSSTPLMIIANEFFDVLPTNCYVRQDNQLYERKLESKNGKLKFKLEPFQKNQGPNQTWEESPYSDSLMKEICSRLSKQSGIFLIIDYGYENGQGDSLQALHKGQPSDPLSHIGKSDLTCHVNFTQLKEIALSFNLGVVGPISQGKFLKNIGIAARIEMLKQKNPSEAQRLEAALVRLTHPQQMGSLFKVMAVFSPPSVMPIGF